VEVHPGGIERHIGGFELIPNCLEPLFRTIVIAIADYKQNMFRVATCLHLIKGQRHRVDRHGRGEAHDFAHLGIAGFVLAPYAAAKAALTPDERNLGAIVIDMGGAVTSCALIRNERLVAATSVNLGGHHLTNDVAQGLATSIAHAERMKTLWGSCIPGGHGDREMLAVPLLGERGTDAVTRVPKAYLTNILRARLEEILELCARDLSEGAFANSGSLRVVLTGGSSQLHGVAELASQILQRQVRVGGAAALNGVSEYQRHGGFSVITGALVHAAKPDVNYAVPQETQAAMARSQVGFARRMGRWLAEAL